MPLQPMIEAARHMISAGHYLATEAGHAIRQAGGNAIDAGVATGIALGVLHSDQVQFTGVAPMVIYLADRDEMITIAGLGGWPRATNVDALLANNGIPLGVQRTVVPAAPDAWIQALERAASVSPGRLDLERGVGAAAGDALEDLGHRAQWLPDLSISTAGVCAIVADREAGVLYGGADPRRATRAMGW
jgi:gamma-glutamyltranspeptidase